MKNQINEDNIRVAAYYIWEQAGRPEGQEKECWIKACEQLFAAGAKKEKSCSKKTCSKSSSKTSSKTSCSSSSKTSCKMSSAASNKPATSTKSKNASTVSSKSVKAESVLKTKKSLA